MKRVFVLAISLFVAVPQIAAATEGSETYATPADEGLLALNVNFCPSEPWDGSLAAKRWVRNFNNELRARIEDAQLNLLNLETRRWVSREVDWDGWIGQPFRAKAAKYYATIDTRPGLFWAQGYAEVLPQQLAAVHMMLCPADMVRVNVSVPRMPGMWEGYFHRVSFVLTAMSGAVSHMEATAAVLGDTMYFQVPLRILDDSGRIDPTVSFMFQATDGNGLVFGGEYSGAMYGETPLQFFFRLLDNGETELELPHG